MQDISSIMKILNSMSNNNATEQSTSISQELQEQYPYGQFPIRYTKHGQEELRKISTAYRKAQVDYSKTAQKLSKVSDGNMSASEALRVKERADKQREKLMEASSKANDFYNNQKKGV